MSTANSTASSSCGKREARNEFVTQDDEDDEFTFPFRNLDKLYASSDTVHCALRARCVPCAYKIGCFDVALDAEFTKRVPNRRPETCPRNANCESSVSPSPYLGYAPGVNLRVLCVGDGDFTFSLGIARKMLRANGEVSQNKDECSASVIATSYEDESTLRSVYPNFEDTVAELTSLGARLQYCVDATRLEDTLKVADPCMIFDRICWNFPCTAISKGQDGQNDAMEDNKRLVRAFVCSAMPRLGGQIHICHKTKPPFNQWMIEELVMEANAGVSYLGRIVLDRLCLQPYTPRKALDKKSFPYHDACVYVFGRNGPGVDGSSFPPANTVMVTKELIENIRNLHLCHAGSKQTTKQKKGKRSKIRK